MYIIIIFMIQVGRGHLQLLNTCMKDTQIFKVISYPKYVVISIYHIYHSIIQNEFTHVTVEYAES